ncbi:hypothetical protein POVCU2_0011540 [Plasmodium ovale curtisi]|uniref:Uncharacterized protein n=1 Tax=Plasmodium ovale curtisi TaxID=864141 RepID=A0A1A8XC28_PLAOA|nr:hypothetical protein POVCU2_0011540 [Plasmodium ovale curtisi]SBT02762.1 hypothetical protein POVCU1_080500 [Plasmodium ovale curtisi]
MLNGINSVCKYGSHGDKEERFSHYGQTLNGRVERRKDETKAVKKEKKRKEKGKEKRSVTEATPIPCSKYIARKDKIGVKKHNFLLSSLTYFLSHFMGNLKNGNDKTNTYKSW